MPHSSPTEPDTYFLSFHRGTLHYQMVDQFITPSPKLFLVTSWGFPVSSLRSAAHHNPSRISYGRESFSNLSLPDPHSAAHILRQNHRTSSSVVVIRSPSKNASRSNWWPFNTPALLLRGFFGPRKDCRAWAPISYWHLIWYLAVAHPREFISSLSHLICNLSLLFLPFVILPRLSFFDAPV